MHWTTSVDFNKGTYAARVSALKAHISKKEESEMAKAIKEKTRSTYRSLLRRNISRWRQPREKHVLPTNINAKEKKVITSILLHYQMKVTMNFTAVCWKKYIRLNSCSWILFSLTTWETNLTDIVIGSFRFMSPSYISHYVVNYTKRRAVPRVTGTAKHTYPSSCRPYYCAYFYFVTLTL